jgi:hypothetical protein
MKHPFAAPTRLPPALARVRAYWKSLLRGSAEMPFWDDAKLTDMPDLADHLFLLDVFDKPERFRFALESSALSAQPLAGEFIDDLQLSPPLDFLRAQASATVEAAAPTFHRGPGGARLLLPMWGDGRIGMLLGAVETA